MVSQSTELMRYSFHEVILAFIHGFRLDISAAGYLLLLPVLLAVPWFFVTGKWYIRFMKIYSLLIIILITPLILGDSVVYSYWAYRLDFSVVGYLKNPKDVMASATTLQLIELFSSNALITFLVAKSCFKLINRFYVIPEKKKLPVIPAFVFVMLFAFLIIPIRGGLGVAPLNSGSVYFSEHLFLNHSALNVVWHFGHTAVYSKPVRNPYQFTSRQEAEKTFSELIRNTSDTVKVLNRHNPNLLLIILESFGSEIIDINGIDSAVAPRFKEYIREGIYFSGLYAAGSRTDKAVPAIFSGYPNLPVIQVIREPRKTQKMPGIFRLLDSAGYKTSFWYGGDLNFANFNSFITTTGFTEKVTMENFDRSDRNSKWGVHDHIVFERLHDSLARAREPFAYGILSLSSHEPFEVPMIPVFKGKDILSRFKNSVYYTDKSLGEFLDKAKKSDWWERTLVVIIADHCRRNFDTIPVYSESIFKIPMLWLGGALAVRDTVISKPCSQFDLPLTLAAQLGLKASFPFSKNILSTKNNSFAFYTYNEGFAFITDSSSVIYDIKLKGYVKAEGKNAEIAEKNAKAFLQVLFDDYLSK